MLTGLTRSKNPRFCYAGALRPTEEKGGEMNTYKKRAWPALAFIATYLLVQPVWVGAQCMTVGSMLGTGTQGGMQYIYVYKTVTPATMCTLTMAMNVIACDPGPTIGAMGVDGEVTASAFTAAVNVSCGWICAPCGQVVINGANDGLPVELLDFKVTAVPKALRPGRVKGETGPPPSPRSSSSPRQNQAG